MGGGAGAMGTLMGVGGFDRTCAMVEQGSVRKQTEACQTNRSRKPLCL